MLRALAVLLLASTGTWGCASGSSAEKRAFLEAGRTVKLAQQPPSHAELRRDIGLFLEDDLLLTFDKAKAREKTWTSTSRIIFGAGVGTVLVGATAGSLKDNGGAEAAVIGAGAAAIVGSTIVYFGPVKNLHECQEFLSRMGAQLRQWEARYVGDSAQPVPEKTWREYVDLVSEIQLHENCLVVR
ncbi:MAG: hypothetical protein ACHQPI_06815 [Thermoanaerobaculia bacterium]